MKPSIPKNLNISKNLLIGFGFLVMLNVFFVGCSVQKRHYLKGWYVSGNRNANSFDHKNQNFKQKNKIVETINIEKKEELFVQNTSTSDNLNIKKYLSVKNKFLPPKYKTLNLVKTTEDLQKTKSNFTIKEGEQNTKTKLRPALTITLCLIGLLFLIFAVISFGSTSPVYFLLGMYGICFIIVSLILANKYIKRIRKNNLPNKKWGYKLLIYLSLAIIASLFVACPAISNHP